MAKIVGLSAWIQLICLVILGFMALEAGLIYSLIIWMTSFIALILLKSLQEHLNNQREIIRLLGGNDDMNSLPDEPEIIRSSRRVNRISKGKIIK